MGIANRVDTENLCWEKRFSEKNQIPTVNSQLFTRIDDFYVVKRFEEIGHLPEYIQIGGKIYKRFLEIFYLEKKLAELSISSVLKICDIRLKNLKSVASLDYNKYIICELIKKSIEPAINNDSSEKKILDFGIGSGISLDCLKQVDNDNLFELVGTDISHDALRESAGKGIDTFYWRNGKHVHPESFDAIFSSFVFDFHITFNEIKRLHSLLKKDRRMVLNMYKNDNENFENIKRKLSRAGFRIKDKELKIAKDRFGIKHNKEKIIIAEKM
ncbi:hypothetical protein GF337_02930 [candidate division KSB1 bacterium]|nr:hypothetical protein [candidate division KSB1 bacterium]